MKKAIFTIALALFAVTGFAQQALFSRNVVKSPEINADNSVTFRLHAPKAITVQLTGDCVDGVVTMKEDSLGVWSYTTPKLEPELYSYSFIVNGMRMLDPSNIKTVMWLHGPASSSSLSRRATRATSTV